MRKKAFLMSAVMLMLISMNLLTSVKIKAANVTLTGATRRSLDGSVYWDTSSVREWLNSSGTVNYTNNPPNEQNLGSNAYSSEQGFLSSFTDSEKNGIAVTRHNENLISWDKTAKNYGSEGLQVDDNQGGSLNFVFTDLVNDQSKFYTRYVNDKVFFLNASEAYKYIQQRGWDLYKNLTPQAKEKNSIDTDRYSWWLQAPWTSAGYEVNYAVGTTDYPIADRYVANVPQGIAPAICLLPNYTLSSGTMAKNLTIGSEVTFGKYLGQPIVWQVINKTSAGYPLLLSKYVLDVKAFDAPGDNSYEYSNITYSNTDVDITSYPYVNANGSYDNTPPAIVLSNPGVLSGRVNGSVTLTFNVSDSSGINYTLCPDGSKKTGSSVSYTVTENKNYTFLTMDNAGNANLLTIPVGNINRTADVLVTPSTTEWTKDNVNVNISATNDVGIQDSNAEQTTRNIEYPDWSNYSSYNSKRIQINCTAQFVSMDSSVPTSYQIYPYIRYKSLVHNGNDYFPELVYVSLGSLTLAQLKSYGTYTFSTIYTVPSDYVCDLQTWLHTTLDTSYDGKYKINWSNVTFKLLDNDDYSIKKITLPDGSIVNKSSYTDTLSKTGTYTYTVETNTGTITKNVSVKIDKNAPAINVEGNPDTWTNNNVKLSFSASDDESGLKSITLPDGSKVTSGGDYNITTNGEYTFKAIDEVGNVSTQVIKVDKIDRVAPTINLTPSDTKMVDSLDINVAATDDLSGVKSITLPDGSVVNDSNTSFHVTKNGIYTFTVEDNAGNVTTQSIDTENIKEISLDVGDVEYVNQHQNPIAGDPLVAKIPITVNSNFNWSLKANALSGLEAIPGGEYLQVEGIDTPEDLSLSDDTQLLSSEDPGENEKYTIDIYMKKSWMYPPNDYIVPLKFTAY